MHYGRKSGLQALHAKKEREYMQEKQKKAEELKIHGNGNPPGIAIRECLKERGIAQKEFALRMDLSEKHISRLINGEVLLTPDVAVRLEMVLGVSSSYWNAMEAAYRDRLAKAELQKEAETDLAILAAFPYSETVRKGWLVNKKDPAEKVLCLRRFFEVTHLGALTNHAVHKIACGPLDIRNKADLAFLAWAQEGRRISRGIPVKTQDIRGLTEALPELRKLSCRQPEQFLKKLQKRLAAFGIALVFLSCPEGVSHRGVTFVDGERLVVVFSGDETDDNEFWFWLFHELGHIVLGHIRQERGTSVQDEKDAHSWARNALISRKEFDAFKQEGDFSEQSVCVFAKKQMISPGIVVGRMQHDELLKPTGMNYLKELYELDAVLAPLGSQTLQSDLRPNRKDIKITE